jgi:hypothetical protein
MLDFILLNLNNVIKIKDDLINMSMILIFKIFKRIINVLFTVHDNQIHNILTCIIRQHFTRLVSFRPTFLKIMKLLIIIVYHFCFFWVEFLALAHSNILRSSLNKRNIKLFSFFLNISYF